ncbi:hypothetical protein C0J52_16939 [Blattella germanica]|nr:hypothetical protein C0J52_16939 [Blattella germanica]
MARGKFKKIYGPVLIGLAVKGAIILISVIGFIMKVVAAKVAIFSLASVLLIALFAYKKYNTPQGGTIFVHSGSSSKSVGSYDSLGSGSSHSHRTVKNTGGYEVWDYSKKKKSETTTPSYGNHQYYSVHYKPYWTESYSTTLSPYGI